MGKINIEDNARKFIKQDDIHEAAHDKNLWNTVVKRGKVASEIPEWEELRNLASQIKEHTLTHLDHYIDEFATKAEQNGIIVHFAKDADEHNAIVYDILNSHDVKRIIKSKSMLQEECGMTPFLEERGIDVLETDLGERIQQLSNERPSHIVMPAIQKTTDDIAKLFAKTIGTDPNDNDENSLTEAMRNNARPKFLVADAGMTGANFAVAETGSFVVCTNEGNADLTASIPPLHIASIGIEKILPKKEDLGVFIRLLSRNALGTPATQYTSHVSGPREGSETHTVLTEKEQNKKTAFGRRLAFAAADRLLGSPKAFEKMEKTAFNMLNILPKSILENSKLDPWVEDRELPDVKKETFRDWYKKNRSKND